MKKIIELQNIKRNFQVGDETVHALRGISFTIYEGEFVTIMGTSGSGKSTLLNTLGCLDTPTSGEYLLDGVSVRTMSKPQRAVLRNRKIGFVFQNFNLLPRQSALENVELPLLYAGVGKRERRQRAKAALEKVGLAQRMMFKPTQLSGGQKQRLSIARAIAKHPRVFIFDDSFSALDLKTDAILRKELAANVSDATVIIVAQRISTILHADQILVMDDGKIVGKGTHEELMKTCETYQQIASSQLSAKELGKEA